MSELFVAVVAPDNPLLPSAYPPVVLLEADKPEQVEVWFKEAQEAGQYQGCHLHSVTKSEMKGNDLRRGEAGLVHGGRGLASRPLYRF